MYQSHWGLSDTPFRTQIDPRFFFESPTHREALARLQFLVDGRRRLGLLLGSHGSGKSLLLEVFAQRISRAGRPVAKVNLLGVEASEFLPLVANEFHLNPDYDLPRSAVWSMVIDRIREYRYQQLETLVLLDDADQADEKVISQISRFSQVDMRPDSRLTVVLAGQRERTERLGGTLLERAELLIDLEPWEPADTERYLADSLAKAGGTSTLFAGPAVTRLHQLAQGVPRRVSQLADLALLAGAGGSLAQIDADTVEAVYHELASLEL